MGRALPSAVLAFFAAIFLRTPATMAETVSGGSDFSQAWRSPLRHTPVGPLPSAGNSSAATQSLAEWPAKPQLQQTPCITSAATANSLCEAGAAGVLGRDGDCDGGGMGTRAGEAEGEGGANETEEGRLESTGGR